jgi:acyl-CoA thioesterase I
MKKGIIVVALSLTMLIAGASGASSSVLTTSPWCHDHDSIAIVGGSTNTGYQSTGYPASPAANAGYYPTTYGWWKRLTEQLSAYYGPADDGMPFVATNYARNGTSAHNFLPGTVWGDEMLKDVQISNPNLLIISFGTNEYLGQLAPETFRTRLDSLIKAVYDRTDHTAILLTIQHQVGLDAPAYTYSQYANVVQSVAVARSAALLDMRQTIPASTYNGPNPAGMYANETPVRIHMSDAGQFAYMNSYHRLLLNGC